MAMIVTPQSDFDIDSQGFIGKGNSSNGLMIISENGLGEIDPDQITSFSASNEQIGATHYDVNTIPTDKHQYWYLTVSDNSRIGIQYQTPTTGWLPFTDTTREGFEIYGKSETFISFDDIRSKISGATAIIPFSVGQMKNDTNQDQSYSFKMVVGSQGPQTLLQALDNGYGLYVQVYSYDSSSPSGVTGNYLSAEGMVTIIVAATIIGGIAAITAFGSGVAGFGQRLIFLSATYLVLWALLSIGMYPFIMGIPTSAGGFALGVVIWLVLTAMYMLGMTSEVLQGGE